MTVYYSNRYKHNPYSIDEFTTYANRSELIAIGTRYTDFRQEIRLNHYKNNLDRYQGKNDLLELKLDSSYPIYREVTSTGLPIMNTVNINLYKQVTKKWVDLLFSEDIKIEVPEEEQEQLDRIIKNSDLINQAKYCQINTSIYGNGVYKVFWDADNNMAKIMSQLPNSWTPITNPNNPHDVTEHIIAYTFRELKDKTFTEKVIDYAKNILFYGENLTDQYIEYLRVEIYRPGIVENKIYRLGTISEGIGSYYGVAEELDIEDWSNGEIQAEVKTNIDENLLFTHSNDYNPNSVFGIDDYTNIIDCVDGISESTTKFLHDIKHQGNILEADQAAKAAIEHEFSNIINGIIYRTQDQTPLSKITWDVDSESYQILVNQLLDMFYLQSNLNKILFDGDVKTGQLSGTAIRRLMANTLSSAKERAENQKRSLERAIKAASQLEVAQGVQGAKEITEVNIEFKDGLIDDITEIIDNVIKKRDAGLISFDKAVEKVSGYEEDMLEEEIKAIKTEQANNRPGTVSDLELPQVNIPAEQ